MISLIIRLLFRSICNGGRNIELYSLCLDQEVNIFVERREGLRISNVSPRVTCSDYSESFDLKFISKYPLVELQIHSECVPFASTLLNPRRASDELANRSACSHCFNFKWTRYRLRAFGKSAQSAGSEEGRQGRSHQESLRGSRSSRWLRIKGSEPRSVSARGILPRARQTLAGSPGPKKAPKHPKWFQRYITLWLDVCSTLARGLRDTFGI